jgi:hypothetical protein
MSEETHYPLTASSSKGGSSPSERNRTAEASTYLTGESSTSRTRRARVSVR